MALSDYQRRNATEYGGTATEETVTYKYRVPVSAWYSTYVPAYNSSINDTHLGTVYFQSFSKSQDAEDDDYILLDLVYSTSAATSTIQNKTDNDDVWLPVPSTFEKPLETHASYKTKWNYDLYQRKDKNDSTPAWQGTATDQSDADGDQWLWAKESPGDNWKKQTDKTKPGVEAYLAPAFAVQYHFWHATYSTVEAVLKTVGSLQTPAETFSYTGEWLVTSVQIQEDGRRYRGVVEYTFASNWDDDLYS